MKTSNSRARFQAPSRHYHRHRVENPDDAWDQWIGDNRSERKPSRSVARAIGWTFAISAFLGLIGVMYYQMS